jgi:uncharacterized protein YdhG (YjbR/CyaY superfamily)
MPARKFESVEAYIGRAPRAQQPALAELRALIRRHLPRTAETIGSSGFPVYTDGHGNWLAGFAWRKKGPMLYIMNGGVLDRYQKQLGQLRGGKSCIDWRGTKTLSIDQPKELAQRMVFANPQAARPVTRENFHCAHWRVAVIAGTMFASLGCVEQEPRERSST